MIEQLGHRALVRRAWLRDKDAMHARAVALRLLKPLLDFALPPRCGGCGAIVEEIDSFCAECWTKIEFLGSGGCTVCGLPLEGTDIESCARCIARPPRLQRMRAATAYGEISRSIAIRLKYGRKVALGRTMARYMAPLLGELPGNAVLVPVPLHRRRIWRRGFNQSAIVARDLARRLGADLDVNALQRVKPTPPLKGMSMQQRRRAVAGAFRASPSAELRGRTVVLVDDVLTTGSTANACARVLKRAGAGRIELVSWARVIRPSHLDS